MAFFDSSHHHETTGQKSEMEKWFISSSYSFVYNAVKSNTLGLPTLLKASTEDRSESSE